ncbi:MAG: hypothetical protein EOM12_10380 [Verrucomicrobiae bacterium]|nr:hypothetical protein [Verrucomicrobiae bacterium]
MEASRKGLVSAVFQEAPNASASRLYSDAADLFSGRQAGHMLHHCYTGKGLALWNEYMRQSSDYYITSDELSLITTAREEIADLVGEGLQGPLQVCELGPGSRRGLDKTLSLCKSLPEFAYYPRDWSPDALNMAESIIQRSYPDVHIAAKEVDFRQDGLSLPQDGRRLVVEFGSSLSNIPGFPEQGLPTETLFAAIANIRANLKKGDFILLGIDQNQDGEMLERVYAHPAHKAFSENILARMKHELPIYDFAPEDFEYRPKWHPHSHLLSHDLVALRDSRFQLARETFSIRKGQRLAYSNSYKYPNEILERVFFRNALVKIRKWDTAGDTVGLFLLEAA